MTLHRYCLIAMLWPLSGCVSQSPLACPAAPADRTARVFFATDRKAGAAASHETVGGFSGERTEPPALQMGWQNVALGTKHRTGLLDPAVALAPAHVQQKASAGPAAQHLYSSDAEIQSYVRTTLRAAIRASKVAPGGKREVLLFVHGFNSSFDWSVRKTAQLSADLQLVACSGEVRGLPVAYSWPSAGALIGYLADEESAEWTQQRFAPFLLALSDVAREEGADLQIVAHSMGTRLVVRTLAQIAMQRGQKTAATPLARQVILLAPDISRALFDQYFQRFVAVIEHLTIYVSEKDHALALSSIIHGGHQRLGLLESTVLTALNITGLTSDEHRDLGYSADAQSGTGKIDMIDVTGSLVDFIGHSYEDPEFISDLQELIYHHTPAGTGSRSYLQPRGVRPDLFGLFGKRLNYFRLQTH